MKVVGLLSNADCHLNLTTVSNSATCTCVMFIYTVHEKGIRFPAVNHTASW